MAEVLQLKSDIVLPTSLPRPLMTSKKLHDQLQQVFLRRVPGCWAYTMRTPPIFRGCTGGRAKVWFRTALTETRAVSVETAALPEIGLCPTLNRGHLSRASTSLTSGSTPGPSERFSSKPEKAQALVLRVWGLGLSPRATIRLKCAMGVLLGLG